MPVPPVAVAPVVLAPLRDDLLLMPGPPGDGGAPTWTVHDPSTNRYFRIGWSEFELLSRWHFGNPRSIIARVREETPLTPEPADIERMQRFLKRNNLVRPSGPAALAGLVEQRGRSRPGWLMWLVKNYLFIRIPLIRPNAVLDALLPLGRTLFSTGFLVAVAVAAVLGLLLVARQWDAFLATFPYLFSAEGAVLAFLVVAFSKLAHEFGHAMCARLAGCRVPSMGIAFVVMWPLLYTDTSDAWRLTDRRRRLLITASGMLAELSIAAFATLLWSFLPDGPLRSGVFLLATTTWVLTLAINLNPLMRFDGYFLLSDLVDMPNLQDRAFGFGKWWLREALFGLGRLPPEPVSVRRRRFLVGYAIAVWVYRFVLFLTIALIVYHFFFKALGIVLMVVEIGYFIVRPVVLELRAWATERRAFRWNAATFRTLLLLAGLVAAMAVPWQSRVEVPAVWQAHQQAVLYAPLPARVAELPVRPGDRVTAGDLIVRLESPELAYELEQSRRSIVELTWEASLQGTDDARLLGRRIVALEELAAEQAAERGHLEELARLTVRAPFDGAVSDLEPSLAPGTWVARDDPIAALIGSGDAIVEGYVAEADLDRLADGTVGVFRPETPERGGFPVRLQSVDRSAARRLDEGYLASVHGGPIPVVESARRELLPRQPVYRVEFRPDGARPGPDRAVRGRVDLAGEARSLGGRLWDGVVRVFVRESGF